MISERVTSGMRNAAAKGKVIGRLHTTVADIPHEKLSTLREAQNQPVGACTDNRTKQRYSQKIYKNAGRNKDEVLGNQDFQKIYFYAIKKNQEIDLSKKPISQFL